MQAVKHEDIPVHSSDSEESIFTIEDVSSVRSQGKQLYANMGFQDIETEFRKDLECQLETGVTCNVMSYDDLSQITQIGYPKLHSSTTKLCLFDGSMMKPLGVAHLKVERNQVTENLVFQVIETKNRPLLSAETCEKFGLIKLNVEPVNVIKESSPLLRRGEILSKYKDVLEGLGHIGDVSFLVDPESTVQHAPRRVPVTLHTEVKEKLTELERKGIVVKETDPTDWISSMVVVAKPNKIRICLDPKDLNKIR